MKILITGPQGSGKTTQAKIIAEKLGIKFISAGDLIREFVKGKNEDSLNVKKDLLEGKLVDDEIISNLVKEKTDETEFENGYIIDGFPRHSTQLKYFDPKYDHVFYLDISDDEAIKRLLLRGREDDNLGAIKERLGWFHEQTEPLMAMYKELGVLTVINGEQSVEKITNEIEEKLKK